MKPDHPRAREDNKLDNLIAYSNHGSKFPSHLGHPSYFGAAGPCSSNDSAIAVISISILLANLRLVRATIVAFPIRPQV